MKKSLALVYAVLCITGMAILAGCLQPDTTDPNNYAIGGTVRVADSGVDVTSANIELWQNGQKVAGPIQPNDDGDFSFNNLPAGDTYFVKISITNYSSWASGSISVPNASALQAELSKKTSSVSGTVISDYADADLTKVKLILVQAGEEIAETSPASDGKYTFSDLSQGTYFIRASLVMHSSQFSQEFVITATNISGPNFTLNRAPLPGLTMAAIRVANDGSNILYLVWNQSVTMTGAAGFSIAGGTPDIAFTGSAGVPGTKNKEWTFALSRAPLDSEIITLSYDNTVGTVEHSEDGAKPESFSGIEIKPRFKIVSAEFKEGRNTYTLTLKFNAALDISQIGGEITDELKLSYGGVEFSGALYVNTFSNSDTLSIILYGSIDGIEANTLFTLAYEDGSIKDVYGNSLANFSGFPVTATLLAKITVKGKVTSDAPRSDLTKVNLRLKARGSINTIVEASPDANGFYEFSNVKVEDRTYYVQAILDLHDDAESIPFTIPGQTQINDLDITLHRIPPSLTRARSENDMLRLTWDQNVTMTSAAGFSITSGSPAITFTGVPVVVANTDNKQWTLIMDRAPDASETITLNYDNTQGTVEHTEDGAKPDSFTGKEIKRPQPLSIVSAEVTNYFLNYRFLTLTFNDDVDIASLHSDGLGKGLNLYLNGRNDSISTSVLYNSYDNTVMILFEGPSNSGTVFTLSYSGGIIASVDGDPLKDFSGFPVTNSLP